MRTVNQQGERMVIERLAKLLPAPRSVRVGIGDDAAVVRCGGQDLLLTSDPLIEGVHFNAGTEPRHIGHKAIGRVLSDLAAMGGDPLWALINVATPGRMAVARLEKIYDAANRLARMHGLAIVGGDLARAERLHLHVFAVGRAPRGTAVTRAGARPGDVLYVTGALGGSRAGRHLAFEPRVREGRWLRAGGWATAMVDLSDGLASDVRHVLRLSRVGAEIEAARIPISKTARGLRDGRSPLQHALADGEDYELLFTVPRRKVRTFESAWSNTFRLACTRIGVVTTERNVLILVGESGERKIFSTPGYEHFRAT